MDLFADLFFCGMEAPAYLILAGCNLGDRVHSIQRAAQVMELLLGKLRSRSSIYESQAWGEINQQDFCNQLFELQSPYSPEFVLETLKLIERKLGRKQRTRWAAREMDLDIIALGNTLLQSDSLIIPHPYIADRRFVLEPLKEIKPEWTHPRSGLSIDRLIRECPDSGWVKKLVS